MDDELIPIFNCFVLCETQLLTGGLGTPYGINYSVVFEVAKSMGIEINEYFIRLLKAFEGVLINEIEKKSKTKLEVAKHGDNRKR